ncbi:MAG: hypothetical protein ABIQ18_09380 [Umezawaea sp.]
MNDFATELAESFAVTPTRTTGLVIDTFDNWSDSTTSVVASICACTSEPRLCYTVEDDPVRPSVSPCRDAAREPALASIRRSAAYEPVIGTICRAGSTVA